MEIEQGQYGNVDFPDSIKSGGMGPCIAVGIYDKINEKGYMIHEANAHANRNMEEFLSLVHDNTKPRNLKIYVTGACFEKADDDNTIIQTKEARDYVESIIKKKFKGSKVKINWSINDSNTELELDTITGKFFVDMIDYLNDRHIVEEF